MASHWLANMGVPLVALACALVFATGSALVAALAGKRIGGAALDVFDVEPMPANHPFLALDNVVLAPHVGYVTEENYRLIYRGALEDIVAFLEGKVVRALNALS